MTYPSGIWAEDIGSTIKKINEWLGKPVVITCDEVTAVQLPQVIECACCTTGAESVLFNTGVDKMRSASSPSVHSGYHSYVGDHVSEQIPSIPQFSGMEREKDTVRFEQWLHSISDNRKNFNNQWVKAAINKSCVEDAADAICCLPPRATLDDIIKKFKWLYGSVESFDTLMQEFYQIVQGKSKRIQIFVLHLEWALKALNSNIPMP